MIGNFDIYSIYNYTPNILTYDNNLCCLQWLEKTYTRCVQKVSRIVCFFKNYLFIHEYLFCPLESNPHQILYTCANIFSNPWFVTSYNPLEQIWVAADRVQYLLSDVNEMSTNRTPQKNRKSNIRNPRKFKIRDTFWTYIFGTNTRNRSRPRTFSKLWRA